MLDWLAQRPLWFKLQLLATLALLLPIWFFGYLPLNDWPNHLASMHLLAQYDAGQPTYVQPNPAILLPNATVFYFMRYVGPLIGMEIAGRLVLSLYLILMPFSLGYLLRQFHPSLEPLGIAGAAMAFNWFFSMGFLNYVLSLPLFLLAAGYWMENRHRLWPSTASPNRRAEKKTALAALAPFAPLLLSTFLVTLAFLTHLVAGAVLALFIFFMRLRDATGLPTRNAKTPKPRATPSKRTLVASIRSFILSMAPDLAAFLPSIAIGLLSLPTILSAESVSTIIWSSWSDKLQYLFFMLPAPFYTAVFGLVIGSVLFFSVQRKQLLAGPQLHLTALALVLLFLSVTLPESTSSWQFAAARLLPFFLFAALLALAWPLAHPTPSPILSAELPIALFLLVLLQVAWLCMAWAPLQAPLDSFAHLSDHMPSGSRVWPLGAGMAATDPQLRISPYFQAWGYWVLQKDVFTPYLFAAQYSPLAYNADTLSARAPIEDWLNALVARQFATRTTACDAWREYYLGINWSLVGQQYDYVALRKGACDNLASIPSNFKLVYSQSPLYLYKTNRTN